MRFRQRSDTPRPTQNVGTPRPRPSAWRGDLVASLVVMLIAVPLSLGIAVASGAPLVAGLISAIVGGVVAGALGGSAVQVSGPAAGLTVIVAGLVQTYGWAATCGMVAAAGVLQLVLGFSKVARAALAVSPNVIHGMLAGVGIVIALSQLHIVLGGQPHSSALENLLELPGQIISSHTPAVVVGGLTLAVLVAWPRLPRRLRAVPAPLVAVAVGTALAVVLGANITRVDLPDAPLDALVFPRMPHGDWTGIVGAIGSLALVAGVESLLCAVAIDRLHNGPRANLNRELAGQGAANLVSGLLGGLPVAGVIVRSTTNVASGARTRRSTILHGVWILAVVILAAAAIELIPLAALAAVLVFIGLQMVSLTHLRSARRNGELLAYAATACGVVGWGLFEGVLVGMGCALALTVRRLAHLTVEIEPRDAGPCRVSFGGSLTLLSVPALNRALAKVPGGRDVELRLNIDYMDHSGVVAIDDWRTNHERTGGSVRIDEVHHRWYGDAKAGRSVPARKPAPPIAWAHSWAPAASASDLTDVRGAARRLLHDGTNEFHRRVAPLVRPLLATLARTGQRPTHLFLACADSRLVPNLITMSGPGDLFTVRNVGNLVPVHGSTTDTDSTIAAIEYATTMLPIRTITVCGHSDCGAMAALLRPDTTDELPHLHGWLRHARPSLERMHSVSQPDDGDELDLLCRTNVLQQLDHLRRLPAIAEKVRRGDLDLVGGYFDIAGGQLHILADTSTESDTPTPAIGTPEVLRVPESRAERIGG